MFEIGLIGLDTSHPEAFARLLDAHDDATVSAVWDGGAVRESAYVDDFCAEYGARRYDDPTAMVDDVDAAMVLTVDWNTHRPLAVPFLEADVPTFIDKPIAGCHEDVDAIATAAGDTPLFGGSAIPFHPRLTEFPPDRVDRTIYCAGYNDPFYYGVHLTDTVCMLANDSWTTVEPRAGPGTVVGIEFTSGSYATLQLDGPDDDAAFGILDVRDRTRTARIGADPDEYRQMYARFIDAFVETLRGERDDSNRIIEGATLLLAVQSALDADEPVTPTHDTLSTVFVDGEEFLADYAPYA